MLKLGGKSSVKIVFLSHKRNKQITINFSYFFSYLGD